jgi:hypothetical protein
MITLRKQNHKFPDLFLQEKSVTKRLSILLTPEYHKCTLDELKQKAVEILNLEDTIVSDKKKSEYIQNINKQRSVPTLQFYITNIMMNGSNLSMKQ